MNSIYYFDLMSQGKSPLPNQVWDFNLSPDGKWLTYLDEKRDKNGYPVARILQVTNAEGLRLDMSYWGLDWQNLIGWQDEKHLILEAPWYPNGNFLILNPFTKQFEVMKIDVPPTPPDYAHPNSSLTYWVILHDDPPRYNWGLLRRDGWQLIWEGKRSIDDPVWSPDGQSFAVISGDEQSNWALLNIGLDGKAVPLTNNIGEGKVLSWSPDSRFLAGWLQMDPYNHMSSPNHLVLIDVKKPLLTDLCIENQQANDSEWNSPPVWSPDGRYLAIGYSRIAKTQYIWFDQTIWDTALIDLQEHRGYLLVKDAIPQTWMRK